MINSSPGDLAPVFGVMLEKATALCDASFGTLATYDGKLFAPAAAHGMPPDFAAFRSKRGAFAAPPDSSLERVRYGESLVHFGNVCDCDEQRSSLSASLEESRHSQPNSRG